MALAIAASSAITSLAVIDQTASATPVTTVKDTVGTEFWTAIPEQMSPGDWTLYVSPTATGSVTVEKSDGTLIDTVALTAGQVEAITLPNSYSVTETDGTGSSAIHIESTVPVSAYVVMYLAYASTGFQVFPVDTLGTRYRSLSYVGLSGMGSRLTVVGTKDTTSVTVTPKTTAGSHAAGVPFTFSLDEGETYQLALSSTTEDLSGALVSSTKPVALISGTQCSNVPVGTGACNPLTQQMSPTDAWGKTFISGRIATRTKGDTYRVLADHDDTIVTVDGSDITTLDAGEFWEGVLPAGANDATLSGVLIETSAPSFVSQYGNGTSYDNTDGDPMIMSVPPAGQYLTDYVVTVPAVNATPAVQGYINLVAETGDIGDVLLDGSPIAAEDFVAVSGSSFSVAQLQVTSGQHSISAPNPVGVNVYELGETDGFGFTGGQAVESIASPPTATPVTSSASSGSTQSVTVAIPDGGSITLLDGSTPTNTVVIAGQGTYTLDPGTGKITFTPLAGFVGTPTAVTYRLTNSDGLSADATYTPTVVAAAAPTAPSAPKLALTSTSKIAAGKNASVPATCSVPGAVVHSCTVTLTAKVKGKTKVIGTATWNGSTGKVKLNATGRALAATVGGVKVTGKMTANTDAGQVSSSYTTQLVRKEITLSRNVQFASGSATVRSGDRAWLKELRKQVGKVKSVECIGFTDSASNPAFNTRLAKRRAVNACAALKLPKGVKLIVKTKGETGPIKTNTTWWGRAANRRATVTLHY